MGLVVVMELVIVMELIEVLVVIEVSSNCLIIELKLIGLIRVSELIGVVTFFVSPFIVIS